MVGSATHRLLAALVALVSAVTAKRQIQSSLSKYVVQSNYTLQMDLLEYFYGQNLRFTVSTQKATNWTLDEQVIWTTETAIDFISYNVTVIGMKSVNQSVLLLTDGTATDSDNYYLYFFKEATAPPIGARSGKKTFARQVKTYPKSASSEGLRLTTELRFYSIEVVVNSGDYYLDAVRATSSASSSPKQFENLIFKNNIEFFQDSAKPDLVFNRSVKDQNSVELHNRTIAISLLSLLPNTIFRTTLFRLNNSGCIEYLRLTDLPNNTVDFQELFRWRNDLQPLRGMQLYSKDVIMAFDSNITRISLSQNYQRLKTKTVLVENLTSMDIIVAFNHVDVNYISAQNSSEVKKIRWDNFDFPFNLDSDKYAEPINNLVIMNKVILTNTSQALSVTRGTDQFVFWQIPWTEDPTIRLFTASSDGITLVLLGKSKITSIQLRSSVYLILNDLRNDTITVTSSSEVTGKPVKTSQLTFSVVAWEDAAGNVYNSELPAQEKIYLDEVVSSESNFNKNVPSSWFLGNFLKLDMSCKDVPKNFATLNQYRYLGSKKLSFDAKTLSSRNIFYYEFYSELSDGSFIFVFQLELQIFFQRCLLSQIGVFRCRTIKKIANETDMIVEGSIFKGRFFMYLTNNGYFLHEVDLPEVKPVVILDTQGNCKFTPYLNFDFICCSNYRDKTLDIKVIDEAGRVINIFSKPGIYSTQIDHIEGSQFIFLSNEYTIDILALRTTNIIYQISSEITKRPDKLFKICGNYLIVISTMMNSFEQYDVRDVFNIVKIQGHVNLTDFGLKLLPATTVKFEKGCSQQWPLMVTDGLKAFAIFINVGGLNKDILDSKIEVGKFNYLANYFLSALSLMHSKTTPRVVWSILDTSDALKGTYFGFEIEMFKDYLMSVDLTQLGNTNLASNNLSCRLDVGSQQSNASEISIQFFLDVNPVQNRPRIVDATDKKLTFKAQEFELELFETTSLINFDDYFLGQPLAYHLNYLDQDLLNQSIVFKQKLTSVTDFSKLIRCSRINTRILDFMISSSTSFYLLTTEAVYKIKNATTYYVQNYMMFTNMATDGVKINCKNMLLNDDNIMVNLCDQANVPFFLVSNWNSLKPGIVYQKQVEEFKDFSKIRYNFNQGNDLYLFSFPEMQQLQKVTIYQKYTLRLNAQGAIEIFRKELSNFPYEFLMISRFTHSYKSLEAKTVTDQYFLGVIGSNRFIQDMQLVFLRDTYKSENSSELREIKKLSLTELLGKYSDFFSKIVNLDCSNLLVNEQTGNSSSPKVERAACAFVQERNIHYILTFDIKRKPDGSTDITGTLKNVFMNYANQVPSGPVEFDSNYLVVASTRPANMNSTQETNSNLTKSYLLLYQHTGKDIDLSEKNVYRNLINLTTGLPLANVNSSASDLKLRILTIGGTNYLFIISVGYFPFETYKLEDTYQIEVLKSVQSEYLNVTAINHYGSAVIQFKIYDKFVRIIIIAAIVIAVITVLILLFTFFRSKDRQKTSTIMNLISTELDESIIEAEPNVSPNKFSLMPRPDLAADVEKKSRFQIGADDKVSQIEDRFSLDEEKPSKDEEEKSIMSSDSSDKDKDEPKPDSDDETAHQKLALARQPTKKEMEQILMARQPTIRSSTEGKPELIRPEPIPIEEEFGDEPSRPQTPNPKADQQPEEKRGPVFDSMTEEHPDPPQPKQTNNADKL